jgi:hypothetical protein
MDNRKRHYTSTHLSTFGQRSKKTYSDFESSILKDLYAAVNESYRNLADIRFKLLALVPAASVIAWVELASKLSMTHIEHAVFGILISLLGLRISYGIRMYDHRNDELYDELISRGRKIEEELGIVHGIFKGRLIADKRDKIFKRIMNHGRALEMIYSSVLIGWCLLTLWFVYNLVLLFKNTWN